MLFHCYGSAMARNERVTDTETHARHSIFEQAHSDRDPLQRLESVER